MKKIAEKAKNRPESQLEDQEDMRVIEDEENVVEEPLDAGECSPEEYIRVHRDPNREMIEIYDEVDGKWVKIPAFETGVDDNTKTEEEMVAEANSWKVTAGIIAGIAIFIVLVFWICFGMGWKEGKKLPVVLTTGRSFGRQKLIVGGM